MNRCGAFRILMAYSFIVGTAPLVSSAEETHFTTRSSTEVSEILLRWLECTECSHEELTSVVQLNVLALPSLIASLHEGPSPASRELMRLHLVRSYKQLTEYKTTHQSFNLSMSEPEYITHYLENYSAQYQIRAAIALGAIGGAKARYALEAILLTPLRKDVYSVVQRSLAEIPNPSP